MQKDNPVQVSDYIRIIWTGKWLITGLVSVVMLVTTFFTFRAVPVYEAAGTIMIETNRMEMSLFESGGFYPQKNPINNECELLKSRTISEKVYDRIKDRPEVTDIFGTEKDIAVAQLKEKLTVVPTKNTDFIKIIFRTSDPDLASVIVNTYASEYQNINVDFNRDEYSEVRAFLEKQLELIRPRLQKIEIELKQFKEDHDIISLTAELDEFVKQWGDFEELYNEAKTERIATEHRLEYLRNQLDERRERLVDDMIDDSTPIVQQIKGELVSLQTELTIFLVRGAPKDGEQVQMLEGKIAEAKSKLADRTRKILADGLSPVDPLLYSQNLTSKIITLEVEWETTRAREEALSAILAKSRSKMESLPAKELDLARLEREYRVNENTYIMMMEKYEEIKIAEAGEIGNVKVIDQAKPPIYPISPKKKLNMLMGMLLGLSLGIGVSFILEYSDTTIKTIEDAERGLRLAVIGSVPIIHVEKSKDGEGRFHRRKKRSSGSDGKKPDGEFGNNSPTETKRRLITHFNPKSPISESYRTLRTNIQFTRPDMPIKTLAVTSPSPKEGKSTTASNLAITMAQMGAKVLLVDTDLRKPIINKLFGLKKEKGLTNLLMEDMEPDEVIAVDVVPNLSVLTSGTLPPNPSELLCSDKMKALLEQLKSFYDYIIFDTPPIVAVTDAAILSSIIDGTLLVVSHAKTQHHTGAQAVKLLTKVNARILGVVINNITLDKYMGKYSYYSYYHYYHDVDDSKTRKSKILRKMMITSAVLLVCAIFGTMQFLINRPDSKDEELVSVPGIVIGKNESSLRLHGDGLLPEAKRQAEEQ